MRFWFLLVFLFGVKIAFTQTPIFELNKKLGKGINMGNMFEAPSETEWGNPFKDDYFSKIAKLGFNHVRIPIRWDIPERTSQISPFTINAAFLNRIKSVIDLALKENLYVIINMHHHDAIFANPDAQKAKFISQWNQISSFFKNYDERILFEVLNEPNTNLNAEKWNIFFADALTEIRKTNPTRAVLMGTSNWGGLAGVSSLKIPKDNNIILTIHYYDPFNFTHQGAEWVGGDSKAWLGTKWENTTLERNEINSQFNYVKSFAKLNNLPIHIGEFGSYSKADIDSRVKWSNFLARWFELQGFSWAYWEFSAGFGIFNPTTNQYLTPLVDALLTNKMAEATVLKTTVLYESIFSNGDNGWSLAVQSQAAGTYNTSNGQANITITKSSTDAWHIQFLKPNIPLKKGKRYLVSFEARADKSIGITNYIGKASDPYNAYSGYKGFTLSETKNLFSYSFIMTSNDDLKSRMVFDLGLNIANISIENIKIEEVFDTIDSNKLVLGNEIKGNINVYPNPFEKEITIKEEEQINEVLIFDSLGQKVFYHKKNVFNLMKINLEQLMSGSYYLILKNDSTFYVKKIHKL